MDKFNGVLYNGPNHTDAPYKNSFLQAATVTKISKKGFSDTSLKYLQNCGTPISITIKIVLNAK